MRPQQKQIKQKKRVQGFMDYNKFKHVMESTRFALFGQGQEKTTLISSFASTSAASLQQLSTAFSQKIQAQAKDVESETVQRDGFADELQKKVMSWFSWKGIKEGSPQQLFYGINLVQHQAKTALIHKFTLNRSTTILSKRTANNLCVIV